MHAPLTMVMMLCFRVLKLHSAMVAWLPWKQIEQKHPFAGLLSSSDLLATEFDDSVCFGTRHIFSMEFTEYL